MDLSPKGRFAYSDQELYCNNAAYFMTGESLEWLCAILNSRIVTWLVRNTARTTGMGLICWEKFVVEEIPIPNASRRQKQAVIECVNQILRLKDTVPDINTSELEDHLDLLIYQQYGLTGKEIKLVSSLSQW